MRKNSNIVVQKYIDDLVYIEKSIDLNDLDEESEEGRIELSGNVYKNTVNQMKRNQTKKMNSEMKFIAEVLTLYLLNFAHLIEKNTYLR